jgi:hypothetical protein
VSAISASLVDDSGNTLLTMDRDTSGLVLNAIDLGYPTVREATTALAGQDGELDLTQFTGGRAITAEVTLPVTGVGPLMDTVRGLMHPGRRMWLHVHRDDWGADRMIRVRGASLTAPNGSLPLKAQLGWKAPGATFQDTALSSVALLPVGNSGGGGMSFPMSFPETFQPGLVPGASILTVNGNVNAPPVIDIYGPCSGPLFRVVDTGVQMSFSTLTVNAGDYLHIDVAARSITINGDPSQSRYSYLDFSASGWPTLPPGSPEVVFSPASSSAGCEAVLSWRSQWS